MRITPLILNTALLLFLTTASGHAEKWTEIKGEHFIISASDDSVRVQDILHAAEKHYQRIASDLGYPRSSNFWLWENRVKIFIYPDKTSYQAATKQHEWSEGSADYTTKEIASYADSPNFIESILPHEMAHLILRDFIKSPDGIDIPNWLDEGVAQWAEFSETKADLKKKALELLEKDQVMTVKDIFNQHIFYINRGEKKIYWRWIRSNKGRWGVLVMSPDVLLNTFYIQSGSLISFLIDIYGSLRFANFCRELRDGSTVEEALQATYSGFFNDPDDLDTKWREYLRK